MRKAAWVVVAAVGLSACTGASKTSTSTQTTTPSSAATAPGASGTPNPTASGSTGKTAVPGPKADYLAKAKPICEAATKSIDALGEPGTSKDEKLKNLD